MAENKEELPGTTDHIDRAFEVYLRLQKMDVRRMKPFQVREIKRAFWGAYGIFLVTIVTELSKLKQGEVKMVLEDMSQEVAIFMVGEGFKDWKLDLYDKPNEGGDTQKSDQG